MVEWKANTIYCRSLWTDKCSGILLLEHPTSFQQVASRHHSSRPDATLSAESSSVLEATIQMAERMKGAYDSIKNIMAPFVLHVNYKAASIYLQKAVEEPDSEAAVYVATLKKSLQLFSQRWLVASEFFFLLFFFNNFICRC